MEDNDQKNELVSSSASQPRNEELSRDGNLFREWVRSLRDDIGKARIKKPDLNFERLWIEAIGIYPEPEYEHENPLIKEKLDIADLKKTLSDMKVWVGPTDHKG